MSLVRACTLAEVPSGEALAVDVEEYTLALTRDGDAVMAIQDLCSHAAVALSEGDVEAGPDGACEIECWLHGSRFDMRSGAPSGLPATSPVATFRTEVRDEDGQQVVYVDVATTLNGVRPD
ncbi:non-heme iron oxygenase ferredoxin subunit [Nocardioides bruguierae]|uniref:non-heme iron oxygenase ferredoxin subunit n=1 Tax=Nocardioides bruguierae TaxID=2945102 RepID=UPI00202269B3|nr:non-heme iron oxygenase ferredoxin subunit [Nocardioides bruguierae]MCL8024447.1 non-heme iron oxygenase ferredoxin subunit [Nocardioides bruguierae]